MARASSSALAVSIIVTAAIALSAEPEKFGGLESGLPAICGRGRAQCFRNQHLPPMGSRICKRFDGIAGNANARQQCCIENCGCTEAGASFSSLLPASFCQEASSRSVSSPGRTTAPFGSCAIAVSNFAVAGIEPVEPAAITGWFGTGETFCLGIDEKVAPPRQLRSCPFRREVPAKSCALS